MGHPASLDTSEPLPFRLRVPGKDTLDERGIRSVSYKVEGLLYLGGGILTLEWTGTRQVERVSLSGVRTDVKLLPLDALEIPVGWIRDARLRGGWWMPRLALRARRLDAFDGAPGARPGGITLWLKRRDRALARELLVALELARADAALAEALERPAVGSGETGGPDPSG